jgi:hypothetical protein
MKQTRVSLSGDDQHWAAITGQEEIVETNTAGLHDGQAVQFSKSKKETAATDR